MRAIAGGDRQGQPAAAHRSRGDLAIVERELVRDRASRSIGHLVTILSLVLPAEPLRIAFQGLRSGDPGLRGTAQEYLEGVLPPAIRERLFKGYAPN